MKTQITLDDQIQFERANVEMTVDATKLPKDILAQLVIHGLVQKVGDSAAGAVSTAYEATDPEVSWANLDADAKRAWKAEHEDEIKSTAEGDMQRTLDQLYEGNWGVTRTGSGVSSLDRKMVSIVRPNVKMRDEQWYKNADESERFAACVEYIEAMNEKQREAVRAHAQGILDREAADRKALAGLDLSVDLS